MWARTVHFATMETLMQPVSNDNTQKSSSQERAEAGVASKTANEQDSQRECTA